MNPNHAALLERFNGFLAKIDQRLHEIMGEAEQGLQQIWAQHPDDQMPFGNAVSGLDHRVRELRNKIQETWDGQIEPKFDEAGILDAGLDRKQDYEQQFDETWAMFKARATTAFFRSVWPRAMEAMQKPVPCTRCGAPLQLPQRHHSVSFTCTHCNAVNQVSPETPVMTWYGGAGHAFGEEAALPLRFEIERFRIQVDRHRRANSWAAETPQSLDRWEQMERAYWTRYAEVRGQTVGEPIDHELIESRVSQFRKYTLETDQGWRKWKGLP